METRDRLRKKLEMFLRHCIKRRLRSCLYTITEEKYMLMFYQEMTYGQYTSWIKNGSLSRNSIIN